MPLIGLVADSKKQLAIRALAQNLFTAPLYKRSRAYAMARCERWYIISARYGLVEPDRLIDPYEMTLDTMTEMERFKWAELVISLLSRQRLSINDTLVLLGGSAYQSILMPVIQARSYKVSTPLKGLNAIQQLDWLDKALQS